MNARNLTSWTCAVILAVLAAPALTHAQATDNSTVVAGITKLENDAVKADLAGDAAFYEKLLAKDWIGGDSSGKFYTKAEMLKMMSDTKNNNTTSETLADLKVRVYGDTAVATYSDTYDGMFQGQHRSRTIISTDTFVKMGGEWKQVASHASKQKGQ